MDEVSYAQAPCQSLPTEPNTFSVSAVPLEKSSSSSPLGSYKVQGIQGEKDNFLNFFYPLYSHSSSFVYRSSGEGVDTKDVKKKSM